MTRELLPPIVEPLPTVAEDVKANVVNTEALFLLPIATLTFILDESTYEIWGALFWSI